MPRGRRRETWNAPPTPLSPCSPCTSAGMGAREMNFHFEVFVRLGFEAAARKVQELYLGGHKG